MYGESKFFAGLTFSVLFRCLPDDDVLVVFSPPVDPGERMSLGLAREGGVLPLLHRDVTACAIVVDVGRYCEREPQ